MSSIGLSGRIGKFKIEDNGVKGEGIYSLNTSNAEINLHLLIGNTLTQGQQPKVPILRPTETNKTTGGWPSPSNRTLPAPSSQELSSSKIGNRKETNGGQEGPFKQLLSEQEPSDEGNKRVKLRGQKRRKSRM